MSKKSDIEKENKDLRERLAELESSELVRRDKIIEKLRLHNQGLRSALRLLPVLRELKQQAKSFVTTATGGRLHQLATNLTRHGPSRLIVNQEQANALVLELVRFLVLKSICQDFDGTKLSPSPAIDGAWRSFLNLPVLYGQFCDELCGGKLLERPENPVGNEENQSFSSSSSSSTSTSFSTSSSFNQTLILYGLIFDERAPASLWPCDEGTNKTSPTTAIQENNKKQHTMEGSEGKKKRTLRELKN